MAITKAEVAIMSGTRTRVIVAGAIERSPGRTRAALLVAVDVEHGSGEDERQLSLGLEAPLGERPPQSVCPHPPARTVHDCPCAVCAHDRAAVARALAATFRSAA